MLQAQGVKVVVEIDDDQPRVGGDVREAAAEREIVDDDMAAIGGEIGWQFRRAS